MTRAHIKLGALRTAGISLLGIFASLTLAVTFFTSTATAASSCDGYAVCFYKDASYSGTTIRYPSLMYGGCYNIDPILNDAISAIDNNVYVSITLYEHSNCTGTTQYISPTQEYSFWSWQYMNDRTSSFKVGTL